MAFTTAETIDYSSIWAVRGPLGQIHPFSRDRLFISLQRSCQHRPTHIADAAGLVDTVIGKLTTIGSGGALSNGQIAAIAQVALNRFDKAASVHYQAFHRS